MNEKIYSSQRADQYVVRFPEGLRDRIKDLAKANHRSMNAEIIVALEARMAAAGGEFSDMTPAASNNATLAGGASINSGNGAS